MNCSVTLSTFLLAFRHRYHFGEYGEGFGRIASCCTISLLGAAYPDSCIDERRFPAVAIFPCCALLWWASRTVSLASGARGAVIVLAVGIDRKLIAIREKGTG
jgi:hypothetical protein